MSTLGQWPWWRCVCGTMTNDDRALDELMCGRNRPNGPLVRHDWQPMPPKPETREARTARRLRALADGYKERAHRNGQAAAAKCEICNEQGAKDERARIVVRLRETAMDLIRRGNRDPDSALATRLWAQAGGFVSVADAIESEESG